jgi:hypothetical protein
VYPKAEDGFTLAVLLLLPVWIDRQQNLDLTLSPVFRNILETAIWSLDNNIGLRSCCRIRVHKIQCTYGLLDVYTCVHKFVSKTHVFLCTHAKKHKFVSKTHVFCVHTPENTNCCISQQVSSFPTHYHCESCFLFDLISYASSTPRLTSIKVKTRVER